MKSIWKKVWLCVLAILGLAELVYLVTQWNILSWSHKLPIVMAFTGVLHVLEEEFFPGGFGYAYNVMRNPEDYSNCYPMNPFISMFVNALAIFFFFTPAALFPDLYPLSIAVAILWILEAIMHSIMAIKLRSKAIPFYSPGLISTLLVGLPSSVAYLGILISQHLTVSTDWIFGVIWFIIVIPVFVMLPEKKLSNKDSPHRYESDREFYGLFYKYIKNKINEK
ncbi:MAG: HXXEE domain-containing protein [Candidatus Hodarchaeota archaeon]